MWFCGVFGFGDDFDVCVFDEVGCVLCYVFMMVLIGGGGD